MICEKYDNILSQIAEEQSKQWYDIFEDDNLDEMMIKKGVDIKSHNYKVWYRETVLEL